jgi:hypothetical protein
LTNAVPALDVVGENCKLGRAVSAIDWERLTEFGLWGDNVRAGPPMRTGGRARRCQ